MNWNSFISNTDIFISNLYSLYIDPQAINITRHMMYIYVSETKDKLHKQIWDHRSNIIDNMFIVGMSNRLKPYNRLLGQVSDRVPGYSVENLCCSV